MNTIKLNTIGTPKASGGNGGNGGGGSASSVEYLDVSGVNNDAHIILVNCAETTKSANDSGVYCGLPLCGLRAFFGMANNVDTVIAVGIDFSRKIKANDGQGQSMEWSIIDFMTMMGINKEDIDALPRLTEEEFYTL